MNETEHDNKVRNREIAENEAERQTAGDVRVSTWAIAVAVLIALAAVGWVLIRNHSRTRLCDWYAPQGSRVPVEPLWHAVSTIAARDGCSD